MPAYDNTNQSAQEPLTAKNQQNLTKFLQSMYSDEAQGMTAQQAFQAVYGQQANNLFDNAGSVGQQQAMLGTLEQASGLQMQLENTDKGVGGSTLWFWNQSGSINEDGNWNGGITQSTEQIPPSLPSLSLTDNAGGAAAGATAGSDDTSSSGGGGW